MHSIQKAKKFSDTVSCRNQVTRYSYEYPFWCNVRILLQFIPSGTGSAVTMRASHNFIPHWQTNKQSKKPQSFLISLGVRWQYPNGAGVERNILSESHFICKMLRKFYTNMFCLFVIILTCESYKIGIWFV